MTACSEARLNANRQNATKSTGPRTPEGKARSSRNALKHGFCAAGSALAPLEDRDAYEAYAASITASLRPATALEEDLARRVADLSWRLRRVPDAEAELFARAAAHDLARRCRRHLLDDRHGDGNVDEAAAAAAAAAAADDDDDDDDGDGDDLFPDSPARHLAAAMGFPHNPYLTLQRYEQGLDRARSRALKELRQLQKDRRDHPEQHEQPPRRNEPTAPSPLEGEGWGEGEAPHDDNEAPLRNEPTTPQQVTGDHGPMTTTGELRNEPTAAAPTVNPSRPLRAFAPSRLPHPELPNEPNPQSAIQNPQSQIPRPPQRFILNRSELRPLHRNDDPGQRPPYRTCPQPGW